MSLVVPWLVAPLVLGVLCVGLGLLLDGVVGRSVPGLLVAPLGFAALIVIGTLLTRAELTAKLAVPALTVCAAAGLAISRHRLSAWRSALLPIAAAALTFGVYAVPVVATGQATFAGWIKLDDGATFLAVVDQLFSHGHTLDGLAPSSFQVTVTVPIASGYPVGAFVPLGVVRGLVGGDAVWLLQPTMAFASAMLSLSLFRFAQPMVRTRRIAALVAVLAAQASLLYGFALWGGLKELVGASLIATSIALIEPVTTQEARPSSVVPLAVAAAAVAVTLSAGGVVWVLPPLVVGAALAVRRRGVRFTVASAAIGLVTTLVLALPALLDLARFQSQLSASGLTTSDGQVSNLIRPLPWYESLGVWLGQDFRFAPRWESTTWLLLMLVAAAAVAGAAHAWERRADGTLLYLGSATVAVAAFSTIASPWIAAKTFAMAAPAFLLAACTGLLVVARTGLAGRVLATVTITAIACGVVTSNVLAYRGASLAPADQLKEIETIGARFDGFGPALTIDFNPYADKHLLRGLDAEGANAFRTRLIPLRTGELLQAGAHADVDDLSTADLLAYRTLVLRTAASASRPPSPYRLVWRGSFYEVWQRRVRPGDQGSPDRPAASRGDLLEHVPLGNNDRPAGAASCPMIERLARKAGRDGVVAAAVRPPPIRLAVDRAGARLGWPGDAASPGATVPQGGGRFALPFRLPASRRIEVWVEGSFRGGLTVLVDGKPLARRYHQLNWPGWSTPFGGRTLAGGAHVVELRYDERAWRPGGGGPAPALGPVLIGAPATRTQVLRIPSSQAASALCGRNLDWVEALAAPMNRGADE